MQKVGISLAGLNLTEIFDIQPLQSLMIKFWYLGLTSQCLIANQDTILFRAIRKNVTFANCFTFEIPIRTYMNFMQKILYALIELQPKRTFEILLTHLRNNKISSVSFQLFGVSFLQLFGKILQHLTSKSLGNILRKIYITITIIQKNGTSMIKSNNKSIQPIAFSTILPNYQEILNLKDEEEKPTKEKQDQTYNQSKYQNPQMSVNTIKGRLQSQRSYNLELRGAESGQYPICDKMRNKQKTNLSCFIMGGFEIVDYSESINQLHKKLLTKILLNK